MDPAALDVRTPMDEIRKHIRHTLSRARTRSVTLFLVAQFEALDDEWTTVNNGDLALVGQLEDAESALIAADDDLDDYVDVVASAVLLATHNDRDAQIFRSLFAGETPSRFARPRMGSQLQSMRAWPGVMQASGIPTVLQIAPQLPPLLTAADVAITTRDDREQALEIFRTLGAKKTLVDHVNAARKSAHGELAKLPYIHPELPKDFADRFFLRESVGPKSIADLEKKLATAKTNVTRLEKQLTDALAKQKSKEEAAKGKQTAAKQGEIDDTQKSIDELTAKLKALQAELPTEPGPSGSAPQSP